MPSTAVIYLEAGSIGISTLNAGHKEATVEFRQWLLVDMSVSLRLWLRCRLSSLESDYMPLEHQQRHAGTLIASVSRCSYINAQ